MTTTTSADGTTISYELQGDGAGPTVVIVNGAFSTARDAGGLASALVDAGLRAVVYDRRARGGSGDARGSLPVREVEDLAAVVAAVASSDEPPAVLGHSSGAVLALVAASEGVHFRAVFCSEPPFHFGVDEPAADLPERLQALVDAGHPDEAVVTFQLEGVGLPPAMVEQIRRSPMFDGLVALAQSTVYDARLTRDVSTPTPAMCSVKGVTILLGSQTFPMLERAAHALAEAVAGAELVLVPESVGHRPDPAATAAVVAGRLG